MTPSPTDVFVIPRGVRVQHDKVRDVWVLLAPERAINLDPVGQAILAEIDGQSDFSTITERLAAKYEAPVAQIAGDCAEFMISLWDRRILEIRP